MTREEVEESFDLITATVAMLGHGCSPKDVKVDGRLETTLDYQFWSRGNGKDTLMGMRYVVDNNTSEVKSIMGYYNDYKENKHVNNSCNDFDTFCKKMMEWITWL